MAKEVARLDLNLLIHDAVANQIDIDKFNGIEDGATADQTGTEIKALYEAESNTNAYTDAAQALVDESTALNTTADTLPKAINEVQGELNTHIGSTGVDHTYIDQDVTTTAIPTFAGETVNGDIIVTGTVDGRNVAADGSKLDTIETNAKDDQTASEIEALYEGIEDTNKFQDAEKTKIGYISVTQSVDLDVIESDTNINNAKQTNVTTNLSITKTSTSNTIVSSDGTDAVIEEANTTEAGLMSSAHHDKLDGIESGATADQTASEILTAIKTVDGTGSGLDADLLDGLDSTAFAKIQGDNTKTFKVSDAINADEALAKGQLLTEIKSIDGTGSGLDADLLDGMQPLALPISTATQSALNTKQDTLVSGTNIKTIAGNSVLGSGDLPSSLFGGQADYQEFTTSGTWTKPAGVNFVYVEAIGGGGSGAAGADNKQPAGGGGGGFASAFIRAVDIIGSTITVTVGAGGSRVNSATTSNTYLPGLSGGDSSFGTIVVGKGGQNGDALGMNSGSGGGDSGSGAKNGQSNAFGGSGGGNQSSYGYATNGGAGGYGGGGGGQASASSLGGFAANAGNGGNGARTSNYNTNATDGAFPGGGGGGASSTSTYNYATSGKGGDGRVRVWAW